MAARGISASDVSTAQAAVSQAASTLGQLVSPPTQASDLASAQAAVSQAQSQLNALEHPASLPSDVAAAQAALKIVSVKAYPVLVGRQWAGRSPKFSSDYDPQRWRWLGPFASGSTIFFSSMVAIARCSATNEPFTYSTIWALLRTPAGPVSFSSSRVGAWPTM